MNEALWQTILQRTKEIVIYRSDNPENFYVVRCKHLHTTRTRWPQGCIDIYPRPYL